MLTHVRLQDESQSAYHLSTLYARVAARARPMTVSRSNLGARVPHRNPCPPCRRPWATHLNGAQLLGGAQHADFTTVVSHDAPSCTSRQTVKNVLSGRARGVFQGKIEVARGRAEDRRLSDEPGAAALARTPRSTASRSSKSTPTT